MGAGLHHPLMLAGGLDHPSTFENIVGNRFLDVNILAGLDGPNGTQGMPMIRGGDAHGIDRFVFEKLANVFDPDRLFASLFFGCFIAATLAGSFVAIADMGDDRAALAGKAVDVGLAPAARTDDCDLNRIVGTDRWGLLSRLSGLRSLGLDRQSSSGGEHRLFEETAAGQRAHCKDPSSRRFRWWENRWTSSLEYRTH